MTNMKQAMVKISRPRGRVRVAIVGGYYYTLEVSRLGAVALTAEGLSWESALEQARGAARAFPHHEVAVINTNRAEGNWHGLVEEQAEELDLQVGLARNEEWAIKIREEKE